MTDDATHTTRISENGRLERWLGERLPGSGTVRLRPLAATGESNEMIEVAREERRWVLRRPPAVKNDPSAHDVLREFRLLVALERSGVAHPHAVLACEDPDVAGVPFYVMDHIHGFSPVEPMPEPYASDARARHELGLLATEALADLSMVPWQELGLEDFGRPQGFLERQVSRWMRQLDSYRVRELAGIDEVAQWLGEHLPARSDSAIIHGDFGLRNVMFTLELPPRLIAIVDWEMATIGDPLIDLGLFLATWSGAGEQELVTRSVSPRAGMASRRELAACYEQRSGRSLAELDYYMALALFKFACILEGSYARHQAGHSGHEAHGAYGQLVPKIVDRALAITAGEWGLEQRDGR
jgi:aminoglycoside phosphotransferase (APT) family kinase protein